MNATGVVGIIGTAFTIIFAFLAFKRNKKQDLVSKAASEGELLSDIKNIKFSIERMEKKMDVFDSKYNDLLSRVIKLEERLKHHVVGDTL